LQASPPGTHLLVELSPSSLQRNPEEGAVPSVRLVIEDQGPGIDPETEARLFEPFFTTRAGEGGTGLGLAIVHSLVRDLGGTIGLSSVAGRGTRFVVDLPIARGSSHAADLA